jgi:hypothetical protein
MRISFDLSPGERVSLSLNRDNPAGRVVVEPLSAERVAALHLPASFLGGQIFRYVVPQDQNDLPVPREFPAAERPAP